MRSTYKLFYKVCDKYSLNSRHDLIRQDYDDASHAYAIICKIITLINTK